VRACVCARVCHRRRPARHSRSVASFYYYERRAWRAATGTRGGEAAEGGVRDARLSTLVRVPLARRCVPAGERSGERNFVIEALKLRLGDSKAETGLVVDHICSPLPFPFASIPFLERELLPTEDAKSLPSIVGAWREVSRFSPALNSR